MVDVQTPLKFVLFFSSTIILNTFPNLVSPVLQTAALQAWKDALLSSADSFKL